MANGITPLSDEFNCLSSTFVAARYIKESAAIEMDRKIAIFVLCLVATPVAQAQADFLVLKKRHTTIERYFPGGSITCRLRSREWIDAIIVHLSRDSIVLKPYAVVPYINAIGIPSSDTLWQNRRKIAIADIAAVPRQHESFAYVKNGFLLQVIGGGYIALNLINTLSAGDDLFADDNDTRLAVAAGIFAIGTIMHVTYSDELKLQGKYKLYALP